MRQGSCRLACSCVSVGQVEELGQVDGGAAGGGLDLGAAGEAVGEDEDVGVGLADLGEDGAGGFHRPGAGLHWGAVLLRV